MEAFVYILLFSNSQYYVGFTTDLKRRLEEHSRGKVESTSKRRPLRLVHYEWYALESDARRRERYLKTTDVRQNVNDGWTWVGQRRTGRWAAGATEAVAFRYGAVDIRRDS